MTQLEGCPASLQSKNLMAYFQLYEWITTLRSVGVLPPSQKVNPAFMSLLHEIGLQQECTAGPKSTSTGTTVLKPKEVKVVVDAYNNTQLFPYKIEAFMVENTVASWNKLSLSGPGGPITWHCENTDSDKKKKAHNVCWISGKDQFQRHQSIDDFELFNFGKIQRLISVSLEDKKLLFARVERYSTMDYELGDIWFCERNVDKKMVFLPLSVLSPPLVTANLQNNRIAVLNSHVRYMPMHARMLLNHIKPKWKKLCKQQVIKCKKSLSVSK